MSATERGGEHVHAEPTIRLTRQDLPTWRFPDPLPSPLPISMGVEIIRAEMQSIRDAQERVHYESGVIECGLTVIEQTLRDMLGGRAG